MALTLQLVQYLDRVDIEDAGVVIRRNLVRRRIAWHDVEVVRLRWTRQVHRPRWPQVALRDGTVRRVGGLDELRSIHRRREREAVVARFEREAARHGFEVEVELPQPPQPTGPPSDES